MNPTRVLLRILVVAGLAVDAYVHLRLAPTQPPAGASGGWSQVGLFYAEGAVSVVAALLVLIAGRRWTFLLAFLVAGSALAAVLLSRYVDIGALGPLPDLYEPAWYTSKVVTTIAEAVATVAAAIATVSRTTARTRPVPALIGG
jgi:hypothetical protein